MFYIFQYFILFLIGGSAYYFLEILWRGYSHISMFVLGGICFISIGTLRQYFLQRETNLLIQLLVYSGLITFLELIFGLVLNVRLGLDVWDYRDLKFNFMGQISLFYSVLWFFLSLPTLLIYRYLDKMLFWK